jgi:hypothetical protein
MQGRACRVDSAEHIEQRETVESALCVDIQRRPKQ